VVRTLDGRVDSILGRLGKGGGCAQATVEMCCRLATLSISRGEDPAEVARQLRGISCGREGHFNGEIITSCADAIGRAIEKDIQENTLTKQD
jgi:ribonucleoside-diphosphate reductase alpha chain